MKFSAIGAAFAAAIVLVSPAKAQPALSKPIEWVVPYPAGGGSDVVARMLADAMSKSIGQTILINNKPGAATNIAADYVAKSKSDGNTWLTADTATLAANPTLYHNLPYNVDSDLAPVGLIGRFTLVLVVHPGVPAKNVKELLAWARAQDKPVNYASPGQGSPHHLAGEMFGNRAALKLSHVPYRGAAPAVQDVVAGHVPLMFVDMAAGSSYITSGRLRALGVAGPERLKSVPEVPTLSEGGLADFNAWAWQGLVVPAGTPPDIVEKLNQHLRQALERTEIKARFQVLGIEPIASTPQKMAAFARTERERWGRVIKAAGIAVE